MRWLKRTDYHSFYFLNATQFLGALNDNLYKLLVIYLLIHVKGPAAANAILSLAGAIFVIPFLLFSSGAGVLADKISKSSIIVVTKVMEVTIMTFGLFSVIFVWDIGLYLALFLMATQSALFGPSKYGIIPELVDTKKVSKANGSMTSFTFLAIIAGTFLASFITDITDKNFVLEASFCILIAVLGLLSSFGIRRTEPQNSPKKINPFFLYEIYQTLKLSWKIPHLLPAIYGSSFFLFIGAFTQLNIIPFAMQSLGMTEVGGGYLFVSTAVGIAIGAVLSGQLAKDQVEPGISCICGFFISFFFFVLYIFSWSLPITIITLGLLGVFGGAYLIPFDAFLQVNSPDEKRGQVIAVANFFSFIGVLLASIALYVISEELGFTAASGFAFMGMLTLISNIVITGRLSGLFFPFFVKKILKRFRRLKLASPPPDPSTIVILESNSWYDALLLFSCMPRLKILVPDHFMRHFPWFNGLLECIRIIPPEPDIQSTLKSLFGQAKRFQGQNSSVCLFFHKREDSAEIIEAYTKVFGRLNLQIRYAHGTKERIPKRFFFFRYHQKQITLSFSKEN
ncbi:MAG: MFS transporter [Chlamydiae bacterium CG10_big_fil_rev_8_21_14_0_10_42_34]|nr:MAG: MFS transporter [Chlamydiae bacterium CG10_big_fil_rev_8_21_14_0_10_42_34]